jgi:hypothetical protein
MRHRWAGKDQLHSVASSPAGYFGVLVRGKVVHDHIELLSWPALSEQFEEGEELALALTAADPVDDLPGGEVQGDHVPHSAGAVAGAPQPCGVGGGAPGAAGAGLQFSGPNSLAQTTRPSAGG